MDGRFFYCICLKSCTCPVQYTDERLDVTSLIRKQAQYVCNKIDSRDVSGGNEILLDDLMLILLPVLLCNVKHTSWSYEREFRCTTGATSEGMPFMDARPKEIYISMHCNPHHSKRLKEIGDAWNVPVYKIDFDE